MISYCITNLQLQSIYTCTGSDVARIYYANPNTLSLPSIILTFLRHIYNYIRYRNAVVASYLYQKIE